MCAVAKLADAEGAYLGTGDSTVLRLRSGTLPPKFPAAAISRERNPLLTTFLSTA
ncbi:hypothetical protein PL546_004115 [Escherichia coli]|nr:hypothetical protein [Escherichia coli]